MSFLQAHLAPITQQTQVFAENLSSCSAGVQEHKELFIMTNNSFLFSGSSQSSQEENKSTNANSSLLLPLEVGEKAIVEDSRREWETLGSQQKTVFLKHNLIFSLSYLKSVSILPLPIGRSSKPLAQTCDFSFGNYTAPQTAFGSE